MAKKNYNVPRSLRMDVEPLCMLASSPVKIGVNSDIIILFCHSIFTEF